MEPRTSCLSGVATRSVARGGKIVQEFASSPEEIQRQEKYGEESDDLKTALHEVIGHGSGKLSDRLKGECEP
jgi:hypothetical protein